jgi:hypothetical protein
MLPAITFISELRNARKTYDGDKLGRECVVGYPIPDGKVVELSY